VAGGQEHGTPGYEKEQVDKLIADAGEGKFGAVIVAYADRWSRDNTKSTQGLDAFKEHGVRFFVGGTEYDLFKPEHYFFLSLSAVIGQFQASHQNQKSIVNRIARAQRGLPACGELPFGRKFDKKTGKWDVDPKKKAVVEDVARRYLAGESMSKLADEYGVNHSNLYKTLTRCCGTEWVQRFRSKALNIHEEVLTPVPALLPEETIQAVRRQAEANTTYHHGQQKHRYLLSRMVFCAACEYTMFGQTNRHGGRYYRHDHNRRVKACQCPKPWVNADELEDAVFRDLFDCFGNVAAVQRAVEAATPDIDKVNECRERREHITGQLAKVTASLERLIRFISRGAITDDQAEKELGDLNAREADLREQLGRLQASLENVPTPEQVREAAEKVSAGFGKMRKSMMSAHDWAQTMLAEQANYDPGLAGWEDRRALAEMVFGGKTAEGKRMGVYVEWLEGQEGRRHKVCRYRVVGRLIDQWGQAPMPEFVRFDDDDCEFKGGPIPMQQELLQAVTSCAGR
jgi:DNA invertase Pin-like site-specific DNA recombinase